MPDTRVTQALEAAVAERLWLSACGRGYGTRAISSVWFPQEPRPTSLAQAPALLIALGQCLQNALPFG